MDSGHGLHASGSNMESDLAEVRIWMARAVKDIPGAFGDILRAQVDNTGKLLRPRFFMSAWRMFCQAEKGLSRTDAARMAASLELLHMATLIHDDILDNARLRRGKPTVFALEGARRAVLSGDLLLTSSLSLSSDLIPSEDYPLFAGALRSLCMGEVLQLKVQDTSRPSLRLYRRQIGAKTATMFALALRYGARSGGAGKAEILRMQRAGYQAGMAFQILDDLKDMVPAGDKNDKTRGRDLESGLLTAPVLCALLRYPDTGVSPTQDKEKSMYQRLLKRNLGRKNTPRKIRDRLSESCDRLGGIVDARLMARTYLSRSIACLHGFPASGGRSDLLGILAGLEQGKI